MNVFQLRDEPRHRSQDGNELSERRFPRSRSLWRRWYRRAATETPSPMWRGRDWRTAASYSEGQSPAWARSRPSGKESAPQQLRLSGRLGGTKTARSAVSRFCGAVITSW